MKAMHAAILTQIMEQEFQLKQRRLLKQEHVEKLLKLKLKISRAYTETVPEA